MLITCCDDLIQSSSLIAREKNLEKDLLPPAKSLLYAAGRVEVPELDRIREQLEYKYGRDFVDVTSDLGKAYVDASLIVKLAMRTPDGQLVNNYLLAIAQIFNIQWEPPSPREAENATPPSSSSVTGNPAGAMLSGGDDTAPPPYSPDLGHVPPPPRRSSPPTPATSTMTTAPPAHMSSTMRGIPDFEELNRRFQALKKG